MEGDILNLIFFLKEELRLLIDLIDAALVFRWVGRRGTQQFIPSLDAAQTVRTPSTSNMQAFLDTSSILQIIGAFYYPMGHV